MNKSEAEFLLSHGNEKHVNDAVAHLRDRKSVTRHPVDELFDISYPIAKNTLAGIENQKHHSMVVYDSGYVVPTPRHKEVFDHIESNVSGHYNRIDFIKNNSSSPFLTKEHVEKHIGNLPDVVKNDFVERIISHHPTANKAVVDHLFSPENAKSIAATALTGRFGNTDEFAKMPNVGSDHIHNIIQHMPVMSASDISALIQHPAFDQSHWDAYKQRSDAIGHFKPGSSGHDAYNAKFGIRNE